MLASALEHVVQGRCYDRTLCGTSEQQEASAFGSASNQPSTSSSVAAELAEAVAGSVDKSVMQAADVIALQVGHCMQTCTWFKLSACFLGGRCILTGTWFKLSACLSGRQPLLSRCYVKK